MHCVKNRKGVVYKIVCVCVCVFSLSEITATAQRTDKKDVVGSEE